MRENRFLSQIKNGEKPVGIFTGMCSASMVECLGYSGFDYVIIDNEHSPAEAETTAELVRAAEIVNITPFVRVREISRPAVLKLLDVGAQAIIVPNVNTLDDIDQLIGFTKYKPVGNRGFCNSRKDGWGFGLNKSVPDTMSYFNERVLLIPQCETVGALRCIEEIVARDGVDGIFVGPYDLSISMGIPGNFENPEFQKAIKRVLYACAEQKKFCILFAGTEDAVIDGFKKGFDSMTYNLDASLMIECFQERLGKLHSRIKKEI